MVMSNELLLKKLKANNANVNFKLYDKGGHTIASRIFKNEEWENWMLERSKWLVTDNFKKELFLCSFIGFL